MQTNATPRDKKRTSTTKRHKKKPYETRVKATQRETIRLRTTTRRAGLEPTTAGLEIRCSIQLSYRRCMLHPRLGQRDTTVSRHYRRLKQIRVMH